MTTQQYLWKVSACTPRKATHGWKLRPKRQLGAGEYATERCITTEPGLSKAQAQEAARIYEEELNRGLVAEHQRGTYTVRQMLLDQLEHLEDSRKAASTIRGFASKLKRIVPLYGDLPAADLRPKHMIEMCKKLASGADGGREITSTYQYVNAVTSAFGTALVWEKIPPTPVPRIPAGWRPERVKTKKRGWTEEEARALLEAWPQVCIKTYPLAKLMLCCGFRVGEALGLSIEDLDDTGGEFVRITSTKQFVEGQWARRKTGEPFHQIDVPRALVDALNALIGKRKAGLLWPKRGIPSEPATSNGVLKKLKRVCVKAGLDPAIFDTHSTRRTFAKLALEHHGNVRDVMATTNWTRTQTAQDYAGRAKAKRTGPVVAAVGAVLGVGPSVGPVGPGADPVGPGDFGRTNDREKPAGKCTKLHQEMHQTQEGGPRKASDSSALCQSQISRRESGLPAPRFRLEVRPGAVCKAIVATEARSAGALRAAKGGRSDALQWANGAAPDVGGLLAAHKGLRSTREAGLAWADENPRAFFEIMTNKPLWRELLAEHNRKAGLLA